MSFGSGRLAGLSCVLVLPAVASLALMSQKPAAAAPAVGLGPQVEVGEPANGYVGRLEVSPTHAPAGTPVGIIEQVAQATRTAIAEPAYQQMLIDAGIEATLDSNPEKFRQSLAADVALWTPIVKALELKID